MAGSHPATLGGRLLFGGPIRLGGDGVVGGLDLFLANLLGDLLLIGDDFGGQADLFDADDLFVAVAYSKSDQGADIGPVDDPDPTTPHIDDLDGYPLLQHLKPLLSENRAAEVFETALE